MGRKLPSFSAVRAFEAAARHRSFKAAAEELCVTQSAISHQVRGLEEFLSAALFHRSARGVELTRCGVDYSGDLTRILDRLGASTERIRGVDATGPLAVCGTPAFANRWLLPRMAGFNCACPEIELEVTTTTDPFRFPDAGVDILIQFGEQPANGFRVDPFLTSTRFPVCSPGLLANGPVIRRPEDLEQVTVLRDIVGDDWAAWFACAKSSMPENIRGPRLAHCDLTIRAAEKGQGVALAYGALIGNEIAEGRLIRLFDAEMPPKVIYSLSCPESRTNQPRIAAFRNWVLAETAKGAASRPH